MLDKFTQWVEKYLAGPMATIANQRHLRAIRDGIIAALPLIIVGSFFLIIAFPPLPASWGVTQFLQENAGTILLPYRMTMYIMALYTTFGIGASLAKSYGLDQVSGGILAAISFLLTLVPVAIPEEAVELAGVSGFVLPMANLGGGGMFVGIVTSIIAVEVYRFTDKSKFKITMPEQVPPAVARSFESLTPTLIVMLLIGSITYYLGFDWHSFVGKVISPLVSAADTLPSVLLLIFLTTFFLVLWYSRGIDCRFNCSSFMAAIIRTKFVCFSEWRRTTNDWCRTVLSMVCLDWWFRGNNWLSYFASFSCKI